MNKFISLSIFFIKAKFMAKNFVEDEQGALGIVEIVILIGIAVLLAVLFKEQIGNLVSSMFSNINNNSNGLTSNPITVP